MSRLVLSAMLCSWGWMTSPLTAADLAPVKPIGVTSFPAPTDLELKIHNALGHRTEVSFTDTPLTDALKFLSDLHTINIIVDTAALQDEGIDPSSPVNLELSGITFRSTLKLMLSPMQLTYMVENEVLKITTIVRAENTLVTRVYPVRDLADDVEELDSVVEALQAGCDVSGWDGGNKSITPVKKSRSLVIRQTHAVHEEIEALLRDLRAANVVETDRRVN